jgi:hypothetical protein
LRVPQGARTLQPGLQPEIFHLKKQQLDLEKETPSG